MVLGATETNCGRIWVTTGIEISKVIGDQRPGAIGFTVIQIKRQVQASGKEENKDAEVSGAK